MVKNLNILDMFCGCGGFSQGFKEAGYNIHTGVDFKKDFLDTYLYNFKNSKTLNLDLFDDNSINNLPKTDIIIAGPPCQGFSLTGPRNINDDRNKLYLSVFKSLKKFNPKAFVVENVRGLMTMWNGAVFKEVVRKFEMANYNVSFKLLNSADYGVPQIRYRAFIVGIKQNVNTKFIFPDPEFNKNNYRSCGEAIGNLPSLENGKLDNVEYSAKADTDYQKYVMDSKILFNHEPTIHKQFVKDTIALVPEGGNYKDLPKGVGESRKFNEAWTRYHSKKPSRTIDTGHRNHFHYRWNRVPTIRENARLQSFKDSFKFLGTKTSQNIQVGNAVPPLLAFKIANQLKKFL